MIGPGDLARAHTSDECVSLREVTKAAEIYLGILENMDKQAGKTTHIQSINPLMIDKDLQRPAGHHQRN